MSLARFIDAQSSLSAGFETALSEPKAGHKSSHWIWYIFPQLVGLGHSSMSRVYGLAELEEAKAYLRQAELRDRLIEITTVVLEQLKSEQPLVRLMGGETDALKLVSSFTLFERAARDLADGEADSATAEILGLCEQALSIAEKQGFPRCAYTLRAMPGNRSDSLSGS